MTSHCQPCFPQIALHSLGSIPDLSPVDKELTFGQKLGGLIGWPCLALAKCSFLLAFPSSLFLFVARNVFAWQGCANKWFLEFGSEVRVLTETWSAPGSLTASRPEAELNTPGAELPPARSPASTLGGARVLAGRGLNVSGSWTSTYLWFVAKAHLHALTSIRFIWGKTRLFKNIYILKIHLKKYLYPKLAGYKFMGKLVQCNIAAKSLDRSQIRLCCNSIAMRSLMLDYLVSLSLTFPIS